jgi:hypothetical protein
MDEPKPQDTSDNIESVPGVLPEPPAQFGAQPTTPPQPETVASEPEQPTQPFAPAAAQPEPVAQPFSQPPIEPQSSPAFSAQPPMASPAKKSKKPLFILLGAIVAVILVLVIGFFVIKVSADKTADTYTRDAKTYLNDVYNTGTGSVDDTSAVRDSIGKLDTPKLANVFLGTISSKYNDAVSLQKSVTGKVSTLTSSLDNYITIAKFYTDWMKIEDEMTDIGNAGIGADPAATLKQFQAKLDEGKKLISDTKFPSKLSGDQKNLSTVYSKVTDAWSQLIRAYDANDQAAYGAALSAYNDESSNVSSAFEPFADYRQDTAKQVTTAADDLKSYADSIKTS